MLSRLTSRPRMPLLNPGKHLVNTAARPQPRSFTQKSQLLLVAHRISPIRPELPYLAQTRLLPRNSTFIQGQIIRLLSTETKQYVKDQVWLGTKWAVIAWIFVALGYIAFKGIHNELAERQNPTPEEWRWWSRQRLRNARAYVQGAEQVGFVNWALVGSNLKDLLRRLEDPSIDGQNVVEREDGGLLIPGVGKAGYDISAKSWAWRACYFEVIMGCAATAEHLSGWVRDKTRRKVFPADVVIGPSNPDPRPVPSYYLEAPLEENCEDAFLPPETYYMKVLTAKGFTTQQKVEAALAYGNWLEFKGLKDSAKEAYRWAVDLAKIGVGDGVSEVIDDKTYVLKADQSVLNVTPNLLRAVTHLAIHDARSGNVSAALPVLLSVLRARRQAPIATYNYEDYPVLTEERPSTDIGAAIATMKKLFKPIPFPPEPPSGDLPLIRASDKPTCEESELMMYIGEILFTTPGHENQGLDWTRQAVTIAEANILTPFMANDTNAARNTPAKCKECLIVGVNNWETMLQQLSEDAADREGSKKTSWFGSKVEESTPAVREELKRVEKLKERIIREGIDEQIARQRGSGTLLG